MKLSGEQKCNVLSQRTGHGRNVAENKEIAEKLIISPHTVRTHTSKIYEKLHVNSKAQAIQMAHKYKWV